MKKLILLLSTCIVVCSTKAQTVHYFNKTVQYLDSAGKQICWATGETAKGKISISNGLIIISPVGTSGKIMAIVHSGNWEQYDEGYQLREFVVAELNGPRSMAVYSVLVLRNPGKQISDVTLKMNGQEISYQILPYKPGEYGYKKSAATTIKRD